MQYDIETPQYFNHTRSFCEQKVMQSLLPKLFSQFHIQGLHFVPLISTGSRFREGASLVYSNLLLFVSVSNLVGLCFTISFNQKH
jgi:hypothetical protein